MSEGKSNQGRPLSADAIYAKKITDVADFRFDAAVAAVFTDMINRSIPGYADLVKYIGVLAKRFVTHDSLVYDLGCSLGAVSLSIDQSVTEVDCDITALDYSQEMLIKMSEVTEQYAWRHSIRIEQGDIRTYALQANTFTVMNFVLQFIPPAERDSMVNKVYQALLPGGAFVLSEKIKLDESNNDSLLFDLHHDFKRSQGYSDMEISQKRNALEDIMKIDTLSAQTTRLKNAGFSKVIQWYQAYNFVSFVAIK